jgi:hypothetical protein
VFDILPPLRRLAPAAAAEVEDRAEYVADPATQVVEREAPPSMLIGARSAGKTVKRGEAAHAIVLLPLLRV